MNKFLKINIIVVSALSMVVLPLLSLSPALAVSSLENFDDTSNLTDKFNSDGSPQFSNEADGGINDSGSITVPMGSNDLWVTKQGYSVSGAAGSVYTFSAYFLVSQNSGYGNLGFTNVTSASGDSYGQPSTGIGVNFHGGGGSFFNNGAQESLSWPPDLVLGNWYWFKFQVTTKGNNKFDLKLQIYNTDSTGTIGTMKTEKTSNDVVNNTMGSSSIIYAFFGAAGSRMSKIDNFAMDLSGSTFVEAGAPIVFSSNSVDIVANNSVSFGGNVADDQGSAVTSRGFCWSTTPNPIVGGVGSACWTDEDVGLGAFSGDTTPLDPDTTYYIRAYATNSNGTSYGSSVSFTTNGSDYDYDEDGIADIIEANGPNSGDANNDGINDDTQGSVTSFENSVTGKYTVIEMQNCSWLNNVSISPMNNDNPDSQYMYPLGLASFKAYCIEDPGAVFDLVQYYYGDYDVSKYELRKYDRNTHTYKTIEGAQFSKVIIGGQPAMRIAYSIADGGPYDEDGLENSVLVDPAGPALRKSSLNAPGATSSSTGGVNAPNTGVQENSAWIILTSIVSLLLLSIISNALNLQRKQNSN